MLYSVSTNSVYNVWMHYTCNYGRYSVWYSKYICDQYIGINWIHNVIFLEYKTTCLCALCDIDLKRKQPRTMFVQCNSVLEGEEFKSILKLRKLWMMVHGCVTELKCSTDNCEYKDHIQQFQPLWNSVSWVCHKWLFIKDIIIILAMQSRETSSCAFLPSTVRRGKVSTL